ncbi:SDR family oxidoreductase [Dactylosporangium sucinum]|uniref:Short-chain dehydrogenase n=1 Tax=Dactylosporangium sucinum TaxID=1424081 RepID=A0A917TMK8_9ACTN|nr:SDR family oxidoreductase [Dactylosporangium sucinum]GGM29022.1 short-chain dehydrogenase [Dactylosporangium sucinum]
MTLQHQRVAVLGGTSGIGLATAVAAGVAGADVVVVGHRPQGVERALVVLPSTAEGRVADLADPETVAKLFTDLGELDHLVYTAGEPLVLTPLDEVEIETARQLFMVRYFGALAAAHSARPHLRDGGSITLTTGTAGEKPGPGWSVAASICGAIDALTRALAVELAPRIRVNAVSPGVTRSPLWSALPEPQRKALYEEQAAAAPLGRVGEVDDVARAYVYSMTQDFATGSILRVDGGAVLA